MRERDPVAAAPQDGPPPSAETRRASRVAAIPSPHLLAPEALLVAAFLATGGAVAALAKLDAAAAGPPAVAHRPRLAEPGCLAAALRRAPLPLSGTAKVRLAVEADGAVSSVELLSGATEPAVAAALGAAIAGCRFVPGADAAGNPLPLAHVLAIDFVAR